MPDDHQAAIDRLTQQLEDLKAAIRPAADPKPDYEFSSGPRPRPGECTAGLSQASLERLAYLESIEHRDSQSDPLFRLLGISSCPEKNEPLFGYDD